MRRAASSADHRCARCRCGSVDQVIGLGRRRIALEASHLSVLSKFSLIARALIAQVRSSAEHHHHELGQAQIDQADQRHHERQEDQHHDGVADHLLAVRPDHLAQLGDDLLQVGPDEERTGCARGRRRLFLAVFFAVPEPFLVGAALVPVSKSTASLTSSPDTGRRDRLPLGRAGRVTTALRARRRCRRPLRSRHDHARRSPHAFRLVVVVTFQCPHCVEYSVEQGRQDLNLQPAVLETAALPVELRPFRVALPAGPPGPRLTQFARSPFGRSVNRRTARWTGKTPRYRV